MVSIRNFTPRLYQETIVGSAAQNNTLIILPTGMGKTKTAILAAAQRLNAHPQSKILFMTVTKPLAEQIHKECQECLDLDADKIALFTGSVPPSTRGELWDRSQMIVSTPQCIENDLINKRISFENCSLIIADEAHNAVKDYAYTWVAKQYQKQSRYPHIIGLTASPGSDMESIEEVCKNLFIEEIEIRTDKDPDVKPYIHDIDISWQSVELSPPFLEIKKHFEDFFKSRLTKLKEWNIINKRNLDFVSKKDLLALSARLRGMASEGQRDPHIFTAISVVAEITKMQHAQELLETQGVIPLYKYIAKMQDDAAAGATKAVKNIVQDSHFRLIIGKTTRLYEDKVEHPKLIELQKIIEEDRSHNPQNKIIVFNQYRDSAADIVNKLNQIDGVKATIFVGQTKKGETGMTQKVQKETLDRFRAGEFNVLVATSIAEQGLDIPRVETVIFYEPIPSAIRQIQRRGRTGRHESGKVLVLVANNTLDQAYRWAAHHKEKRMYRNLDNLKNKINHFMHQRKPVQPTLAESIPEKKKVVIYADHREKSSSAIKSLIDLDCELKTEQLPNADYILSARVGVELKKVPDFVQSIIDGRLLEQMKNLKNNFERPLVVIEGVEDIYSVRNVHPNAIRGMLAAITVGYGIPILYTKNAADTAATLFLIAQREQEESDKDFSLHPGKKALSFQQQQEYIVGALPNVGPTLAKPLLHEFKTVRNIMNASVDELKKIENIGDKKAEKIREILDREYQTL